MNKELLYAQLCQELGHLHANKSKIEKRIAEIEAEIQALDRLAAVKPGPRPVEPAK